jgi:DNA-binding CsgD family transcriptional regulator
LKLEPKSQRKESEFAEVIVGKLLIESFAVEQSPYHKGEDDLIVERFLDKIRGKLKWHIDHSLSPRQKQVVKYYLLGKKEREIAKTLGITQQVVNIYKHRAIKKLHRLLAG